MINSPFFPFSIFPITNQVPAGYVTAKKPDGSPMLKPDGTPIFIKQTP